MDRLLQVPSSGKKKRNERLAVESLFLCCRQRSLRRQPRQDQDVPEAEGLTNCISDMTKDKKMEIFTQ